MRIKEVRTLLSEWRDRLNLTQWDISVYWAASDIPPDIVGTCWWFTEEEKAEIHIRQTEDADVEETLVHELIHLSLEGHKEPKHSTDRHYEQGINKLARALVRARRGQWTAN
mgnify:CR=1 FL=1